MIRKQALVMWLLAAGIAVGCESLPRAFADDKDKNVKGANRNDPSSKLPASKDGAKKAPAANPFPQRTRLPQEIFDGGKEWLNVSGPIELRDLRGKIVLVDFWTYCCINCMHVLPDLKFLEHKYPKEIVVIGVHSAKFENEKDSENIRRAILRYEIEHPVVNDAEMTIWRKFGTRSWPTLVVIDPEGNVIGAISGEGHREILDEVVAKLVAYHKATGTLDPSPLRLGLERAKQTPSPLKFPGKIIADEPSRRLLIADSGHNRIVICSLEGKLIDVVGTGAVGAQDGPFTSAAFDHPQGMALDGNTLYVADTENHLIRVVDLEKKTVATLAGTGRQAQGRDGGGKLRATPLNSPWDLLLVDKTLYVAMAGPHQIWAHVLGSDTIQLLAGSGREDILDGPRDEAAFAQPSGLATDGKSLFVADSEGSAVRKLALEKSGPVSTLAGTSDLELGRSLFEFGDVDGVGKNARFQHPLGVLYHDGRVFVADTYNHKIKTIDVATNETKTWLGDGKRGAGVSPPQFSEPAGLAAADRKLFIADTNNHAIKIADLQTRNVSLLKIDGLSPPVQRAPSESNADEGDAAPPAGVVKIVPQRLAANDALRLEFSFELPVGYKLNKAAPATCRVRLGGPSDLISEKNLSKRHRAVLEDQKLVVTIPWAGKSGKAVLETSLSFTYCRDGVGGLCKLGSACWTVPIELAVDSKQTSVSLSAVIPD